MSRYYPRIKKHSFTASNVASNGGFQEFEITSSVPYKIIGFLIDAPAPTGATAGEHVVSLFWNNVGDENQAPSPFQGRANFDTRLFFSEGSYATVGEKQYTGTLDRAIGSKDVPLIIRYSNGTDADQVENVTINIVVQEGI